jgi:ribosomal protein L9
VIVEVPFVSKKVGEAGGTVELANGYDEFLSPNDLAEVVSKGICNKIDSPMIDWLEIF